MAPPGNVLNGIAGGMQAFGSTGRDQSKLERCLTEPGVDARALVLSVWPGALENIAKPGGRLVIGGHPKHITGLQHGVAVRNKAPAVPSDQDDERLFGQTEIKEPLADCAEVGVIVISISLFLRSIGLSGMAAISADRSRGTST